MDREGRTGNVFSGQPTSGAGTGAGAGAATTVDATARQHPDKESGDNIRPVAGLTVRMPFSSKLCNRCVYIQPLPPIFEFDIADSCIGDSTVDLGKILYKDGLTTLSREDFRSLEPDNVLVSPPMISAWAMTQNYKWGKNRTPHAALELINWDVVSCNYEQVMLGWKKWLTSTALDITACEIIFIPVRKNGHTTLFVVNFSKRKVQCFDTCLHQNMEDWHKLAEEIFCLYCTFMCKIADPRATSMMEFEYQVLNPHWSTATQQDGGMFVMQIMESFDGSTHYFEDIMFDEDALFLGKRLTYCCRIVLSQLNQMTGSVMTDVAHHLQLKISGKSTM